MLNRGNVTVGSAETGTGSVVAAEAGYREIRFEHSPDFPGLLSQLGVSLVISTYQANKVAVMGADPTGGLSVSLHNFERAMGVAARRDGMVVGSMNQIWYLRSVPRLLGSLTPGGHYDACFLAHASRVTGDIEIHEITWAGEELWIVNTLFSCLCTLHKGYHFVPRWRPPFVSALAAEDRCHLNGLAMAEGGPKYVTVLGESDTPKGWRENKAHGGCLIDVGTKEVVARGFAMPHSPRVHRGGVWMLDSGRGRLVTVDPANGKVMPVTEQPGYLRGLALHESYAFVGLSKIRETATFGGVPIAERRDSLKCGVGVVDLETGRNVAHFEFKAGVDEIFDVQVLAGIRLPAISGPFPLQDGTPRIWMVPETTIDNVVAGALGPGV